MPINSNNNVRGDMPFDELGKPKGVTFW